MKLFERIPDNLFSVLSCPNKELYSEALDVLYITYKDHLKIKESELYTMIKDRLQQQLLDADFDSEDIDEEEKRNISGRARFVIRKLCQRGWFEKERGSNFEEYVTVPEYSSRLIELFHQINLDNVQRGSSYVFGTFSMLKVADESDDVAQKLEAVYSAYNNTEELISLLSRVYHNVKRFFKEEINMKDINEVLASHYDDFGINIADAYIKPLKIKESVPKYKVPIQTIIKKWLADNELIDSMAIEAYKNNSNRDIQAHKTELLQKMYYIKEKYGDIEAEFLNEIDIQVRHYTRATTQKIENLTNQSHNIRGDINYILGVMADKNLDCDELDLIQSTINIYEQRFISDKSLWYRKRAVKKTKTEPVVINEMNISDEMIKEVNNILNSEYSKEKIYEYIESCMANENTCKLNNFNLSSDKAYVMSLLAVVASTDNKSPYKVNFLNGRYFENGYTVPNIEFVRKENKK